MVRNTERVGHVKTLRGHARACEVDPCADDASRQLVIAMMGRIRGATGHARKKRAAEAEYTLYEATFPPAFSL
jgi:hypothetical protein